MSKQRLEQKQHYGLSHQQIQFLGILQIPIVSLEHRIEEEIEDNPALEENEREDVQSAFYDSSLKKKLEDFQIEDKSESLSDYLKKQLVDLSLDEEMLFLVKYLINSLDNNGFLKRDLYSINSDLLVNNKVVSEKKLKLALQILQNLDPVGVGTTDLQNCILLQLLKKHPLEKEAYQIILNYYTQFYNKNFEYLIEKVNITKEKLKNIYRIIERLKPIPSDGFTSNNSVSKYIFSDFTIEINNNEPELRINKGNTKTVKVSNYYSNLLKETKDVRTKDFLTKKIDKAKWFKEALVKRDETLRMVMTTIIQLQKDYLISGIEKDLKPMKLADIADIVNMDVSTISRVSNSKFVETHFGTFRVKEFFSDAYMKKSGEVVSTKEIKKTLKKIILNENKIKPYTDEQLADLLGGEEYHIARRTVAKYRKQLSIKTSKLRREL